MSMASSIPDATRLNMKVTVCGSECVIRITYGEAKRLPEMLEKHRAQLESLLRMSEENGLTKEEAAREILPRFLQALAHKVGSD